MESGGRMSIVRRTLPTLTAAAAARASGEAAHVVDTLALANLPMLQEPRDGVMVDLGPPSQPSVIAPSQPATGLRAIPLWESRQVCPLSRAWRCAVLAGWDPSGARRHANESQRVGKTGRSPPQMRLDCGRSMTREIDRR